MENIEFIAAKDLPTTEAKEVDVLCVDPESGEMKRKPGASLGGSKGYVYAFDPSADSMEETDEGTQILSAGNYDEIAETLYNGGTVWIDLTLAVGTLGRIIATSWTYAAGNLMLTCNMDGASIAVVFSNGTWTPPTA